jgi:hypothetical protein
MNKTWYVLWATRKGDPDYAEQVIADTVDPAKIKAASAWAKGSGFDRLRVMVSHGEHPDWASTVQV